MPDTTVPPPGPNPVPALSQARAAAAELEAVALQLAEGAAEVVRAGRGTAHVLDAGTIDAKSSATDLVTEVDRHTERWLVDQIAVRRPGDTVLGEEGGDHSDGADPVVGATTPTGTGVRWVLDPIDGTVNFVLGIPQYAVSVAAEVDGRVVAGAVCNPATGETFHARVGGGAYVRVGGADPMRLSGPRAVPLDRAVVATGFGYDAARRVRQIAVVAPMLPVVADIRRLGSAALDLCFLAVGRLDGYFEAGLNLWDYAAGALIATEAGCVVSGLRGQEPSGRMLAACRPQLAGDFFAMLERLGADEV